MNAADLIRIELKRLKHPGKPADTKEAHPKTLGKLMKALNA